jgi:hypothetical protein
MPDFRYDLATKRFRGADGRFLSQAQAVDLRNEWTANRAAANRDLTLRLANGELSVQQWQAEMMASIKETWITSYLLGRGGRAMMEPSDWGRLGALIKEQYQYLRDFAAEIVAGRQTPAQVIARSGLYASASTQAYEEARNTAYEGMPTLPGFPADGATQCRANCKCRWSISETVTEWRARWTLGAAEHCSGCVERAGKWGDLRFPKRRAAA